MPDIDSAARRLGCDPSALHALLCVEAAGVWFTPTTNLPVIRFEVHVFWERVRSHGGSTADVDRVMRVDGPKPWQGHRLWYNHRWLDLHTGSQAVEWAAWEVGSAIDAAGASEATSWGGGQVLGRNWPDLGFSSVEEFRLAQYTEEGQLDTIVRFIESSPRLHRALREGDEHTVALLYNGSGKVDDYSQRLHLAGMS